MKTKGLYPIVSKARDEANPSRLCLVYRSLATGDTWIRDESEFMDGRFRLLDQNEVYMLTGAHDHKRS